MFHTHNMLIWGDTKLCYQQKDIEIRIDSIREVPRSLFVKEKSGSFREIDQTVAIRHMSDIKLYIPIFPQ